MLTRAKDLIQGKVTLNTPHRSSKWSKVRNRHIEKNPTCEVCGGVKKLNVHHIKPYNHYPELELEPSNLITLCESKNKGVNCHLLFGHLGNYKNINLNVVDDCVNWKAKLTKQNSLSADL